MTRPGDVLPETILLVDDEEGIRTVVSIILADMGHNVLKADSGLSAYELFMAERPSIIITDIKMPGMDGVELLEAVKQISPDTEVIMTTGHGDMDLAVQSLRLGAADFITKPLGDGALEVAIRRAQERLSLKQQLRRYTEELEDMVEAKTRELLGAERMAAVGQTVAEMSHAIKNMAGGLEGSMYVLERGLELGNPEYLEQGWQLIRRDVLRLKTMALDLLDFARPDSVAPYPSDLSSLAKEACELMGHAAREAQVELAFAPSSTPILALVDPEAVHRAVLNLLANAIESFEYGGRDSGRRITVYTANTDTHAELAVQDNGPGMPQAVQERLFTGFFSTKGGKGTGIGLMATKKIVEQMSGAIAVDSTPEGITITLRFQPGEGANG